MSLIKLAGELSSLINGAASFARSAIGAKAAIPFATQQAAHVANLTNPLYRGMNKASVALTGQKAYTLKDTAIAGMNNGLNKVETTLGRFPKVKNFLSKTKDIGLELAGG